MCLWFWSAYLVATLTPGTFALQLQRQLGIKRYETAFNLLHKLRSSLVAPEREPLRGEVEIDEAFIGGPEEGKPGRGAEKKTDVVVAVEVVRWKEEHVVKGERKMVERKRAGRTRIAVIPNAEATTLLPWVRKNVEAATGAGRRSCGPWALWFMLRSGPSTRRSTPQGSRRAAGSTQVPTGCRRNRIWTSSSPGPSCARYRPRMAHRSQPDRHISRS